MKKENKQDKENGNKKSATNNQWTNNCSLICTLFTGQTSKEGTYQNEQFFL